MLEAVFHVFIRLGTFDANDDDGGDADHDGHFFVRHATHVDIYVIPSIATGPNARGAKTFCG